MPAMVIFCLSSINKTFDQVLRHYACCCACLELTNICVVNRLLYHSSFMEYLLLKNRALKMQRSMT